jgi:hypothetical protein
MTRWLAILLIACGGSSPSSVPTPSGPPASFSEAPPEGDVQVATVNGRAVWGSCVRAQAARGATRDAALAECIDFELLAQAAQARDLALDPDVVLATRTALVSELVGHEYEDKYQRPEDFGPFWTRSIERNKGRFDHPEARGSVYVRIDVAKDATAEIDADAKRAIDRIYAALANERGLMKPHVEEIARRVAGDDPRLKIAAVPPDIQRGRLHELYVGALFAIAEIGRVSPPVRTPWGWDIVLWDSVVPAVRATPAELVAKALPEIKRSYFPQWVNQVAKRLGVKIQLVEENLHLLENL